MRWKRHTVSQSRVHTIECRLEPVVITVSSLSPSFSTISSPMRRWHSFSLCRRLAPLNRRPVSCSPIHSSAQLAPTASQPHFDSQTSVTSTHDASSTPSSSKSSITSVTARHPNRLQHGHTLTVLHTARELIARILPPQSVELSFWNDVLCDVSNEISRSSLISKEDKVTIVGAFWVCNSNWAAFNVHHHLQFIPWTNSLEGNRS
jgi:hypothetical protein